jgi:hypothetical protein
MHHLTWLVCWDGVSLTTFYPDRPLTTILLISASWLGGIIVGSHCRVKFQVFIDQRLKVLPNRKCCFCGSDLKVPLKPCVWKVWSSVQQCSEVGQLKSECIRRVLTSSVGESIDECITEWTFRRWA